MICHQFKPRNAIIDNWCNRATLIELNYPMKNTSYLRSATMISRALLIFGLLVAINIDSTQAQTIVKYGADFLAGGVGGRALGMGGAHVGLVEDVHAGYWNPAGLSAPVYPEIAYMHAERFAGVVSFDYGSVVYPVNARSTVSVSFFRSGVNDIKNTLDAWNPERNQPKPYPENHIKTFSAADMAFFVSYARAVDERLSVGFTGKIIRRAIGDFADAWGYSFDVGVRYRMDRLVLGANLQDIATMRQSWTVNQEALRNIVEVFGEEAPQGGIEVVLPVARLGSGYVLPIGENSLTFGLDVDVAFDGQQANALNMGKLSFHPRLGAEFMYKRVVALRAGLSNLLTSDTYGANMTPSVGAGLQLKHVALDYGFGDFAGLASELGFSHRISARFTIRRNNLKRAVEAEGQQTEGVIE